MAYQLNPEDELNQNPLTPTTSNSSGVLTAGTQASSGPDQKVQQGTGWTNLDQYLKVNEGQATGLANDLTKDVNQKVDSFKGTDSSSAVAEINKQAGSDVAKSITNNVAQNAGQAKDFLSKQVNVNPNDYTAGVRTQGSQIKDTLGQVDNQRFQQGQLQKIYGQRQPTQPNQGMYTSGFGALDSFLLFGDQDSKGKLQQVKARTGEVDNKVQDYSAQIDNAVSSTKDQLAKNQAAIRDAAKGQYNSIYSGAQGRVDAVKAQQRRDAENKAAEIFAKKKGEYAGFINDGADGDLGFGFIKGNDKFGVNNVVNDEEVAALNALAGIDAGLGLGTITKDNSSAVNFDAGGWESLLSGLGSKRKTDKEEANRKAAEEAEKARLQKILDEQKARDLEAAKAKSAAIGSVFGQAYSMPEGYNPNPPPSPPPTNTKSKEEVIGTDISDAGKQIAAAPGGAWDALTAPLQPAAKKLEKKGNATINNAKKGKVKF